MPKARKTKWQASVDALIRHVRKLKDQAVGLTLRRLHGIESQLYTVGGYKRALPSQQRKDKRKKNAKMRARVGGSGKRTARKT